MESLIKRVQSAPILVVGDVMVDEYVLGTVDRVSPEAPVPVLLVKDRLRRLGGAGNVVRNIVAMGGSVALFAAIGKDEPGRWFKQRCKDMGVETFWLKEDATRPTTVKTRVVARNQQMVRIDEENVQEITSELESQIINEIRTVIPQVKAAVVSDYGKGFSTPGILAALAETARKRRIPVVVDPKGLHFSRYRGASYITPNVREASLASGIEIKDEATLVSAARSLLEQAHVDGIVVTRGKEGSTLVTRDRTEHFPVKPVEIIDVTGAGDTVVAALGLSLASGFEVNDAINLSNLAASIVVSKFGAASVSLDDMLENVSGRVVEPKICRIEDISATLRSHRVQGRRVVFTNGCFDLFHTGHLKILEESSKLGEVLVVGVNSDDSVRRLKGPGRPVIPEADRMRLLSALSFVDYVAPFSEDTPKRLIEEVRPDVLVKGADWRGKEVVGSDVVKARGGRVEFVELVDGLSTTAVIARIRSESDD